MGRVKSPKIPPPPPVEPIPMQITETGEQAAKKARRKRGYQTTILAGSLAPMTTGKKTVLG